MHAVSPSTPLLDSTISPPILKRRRDGVDSLESLPAAEGGPQLRARVASAAARAGSFADSSAHTEDPFSELFASVHSTPRIPQVFSSPPRAARDLSSSLNLVRSPLTPNQTKSTPKRIETLASSLATRKAIVLSPADKKATLHTSPSVLAAGIRGSHGASLITSQRILLEHLTPSGKKEEVKVATFSKGSHSVVFSPLKSDERPFVVKAIKKLSADSVYDQNRAQFEQYERIKEHCQVAHILNNPMSEQVTVQQRIDGERLRGFEGLFSESQMSDLKNLLECFISEYEIDSMLDLQPDNLIVSKEGRIVLVDFNEGLDGMQGILQLKILFNRGFPEESPRFDQAIELLRFIKEKNLNIYTLLMSEGKDPQTARFYKKIES